MKERGIGGKERDEGRKEIREGRGGERKGRGRQEERGEGRREGREREGEREGEVQNSTCFHISLARTHTHTHTHTEGTELLLTYRVDTADPVKMYPHTWSPMPPTPHISRGMHADVLHSPRKGSSSICVWPP